MSHRRPADPRNVPSPRGPASRPLRAGLAPAAALALGAALVLGAPGEAAAQGVCAGALPTAPNSNVGGVRIVCQESNPSASGIRINAESVSLSVTSSNFAFRPAIDARLNSASDENDVNVRLGRGLVISTGAAREAFIGAYARNAGSGGTFVVMEDDASITTTGGDADGIRFSNPTAATGTSDIQMTGGSITTSGTEAHGIYILHNGSGASTVSMSGGAIKASGSLSSGIYVNKQRGSGDATITFSGGSIEKSGGDGAGIGFYGNPAANVANARIRVTGGSIAVEGVANAHGVYVDHRGAGGGDVAMTGGSITASGDSFSHGVFAFLRNAANEAPIVIGMAGGSIATKGRASLGLYGAHRGLGSVTVTMEGEAEIATSGDSSEGMFALLDNAANEAAIVIGMAGGSVATEGRRSSGLYGAHHGLGSVTVTTGGEAEIETPFAVGVEGRLVNAANAAGRLVVTHGGAVEARDVGVLAWAARRSGHTSGDGAEEADDAARTEPMIHVTSSGDVTVGAQVTDAFIRNRIAGDDGTLSARERAVLDAITADDSDALTTALEALPADYDDDWKAEAENLRRKRAEGTDDSVLAARATEEILGLTRAGVRALALSHETITGHVRFGDGDRAFSDAERTALEAALTGRGLETALAALPAAYTDAWKDTLRAHAASYNAGDVRVDVTGGTIAAEGDGVDARYALAHDRNGAIAVTVADGAEITGGRHGVHVGGAGLAAGGGLRAQTVTVNGVVMGGTGAGVHLAGGGRVTVGRTGRVGAASGDGILSDGAGNLVATVAGTVEGHVRAQGGGDLAVTVEREGEITGDVRASGGGDLSATVAGTVKGHVRAEGGGDLDATISGTVEGDLRAVDGGALTVDVQEGGVVKGTVHDPAGPLTVAGSIGRLLYTNGGTVTVTDTGRLTGVEVEGRKEAIRSEAGDLAVTVAAMGTITGNIRAMGGGALTVDVQEGGVVKGTVHDPADPFTVTGSIGRLLYTNGGTVTVAATGRITGVEGESEAIRSEAGDLAVTVAEMGAVTGDVRGLGAGGLSAMVAGTVTGDVIEEGAGDLDATVSGTVEGNVFGRGTGEHTVTVSNGGTVTGTIHLAASTVTVHGTAGRVRFDEGGTVTVGGTGKLTGVEGGIEAIRSEAGDLAVTVAGMVTGDLRALGGGDLDATISGMVEGDLLAQGGGALTVDVKEGGAVTGTVHDPAGPLTVAGSIGRLLYTNGGAVTVSATGKLTGVEVEGRREAIRSEAGDLKLTLHERAGETPPQAVKRIDGTIRDPKGSLELCYVPAGGGEKCASDPAPTVPQGAWDVWLGPEGGGVYRLDSDYAPRSRVYEALPSVLLGLNAPARFEERMAAARAEQGGWARVETVRGKWKADASTTAGVGVRPPPARASGGYGRCGGRRRPVRGLAASSAGLGGRVEGREGRAVGPRRGGVRRLGQGRRVRGRPGRGDAVRSGLQVVTPWGAEAGRVGPRVCVGGGDRSSVRPGRRAGRHGAHAAGRAGAFEGFRGRLHGRGGRARVVGGRAEPQGPCGDGGGGEAAVVGAGEPGVRLGGRGARALEGPEGPGVGDGVEVGGRCDVAAFRAERLPCFGRRPVDGCGEGGLGDERRQRRARRRTAPESTVLSGQRRSRGAHSIRRASRPQRVS